MVSYLRYYIGQFHGHVVICRHIVWPAWRSSHLPALRQSLELSKPSSRSWDPWTGAFYPLRDARVLACMLVCTCTCRCPARRVRGSPCGEGHKSPMKMQTSKHWRRKEAASKRAASVFLMARVLCRDSNVEESSELMGMGQLSARTTSCNNYDDPCHMSQVPL